MWRFTLRNILLAFVWWALAVFVVAGYYSTMAPIWESEKKGLFICFVQTPTNPLLACPFTAAGVLALFGRMRTALFIGLPFVLLTIYWAVKYYADERAMEALLR